MGFAIGFVKEAFLWTGGLETLEAVLEAGFEAVDGGLEAVEGGFETAEGGLEAAKVGLETFAGGLDVDVFR